ncbi:hypothetical protein [Polaromonas sp.]|uniref:hypothetical protein n=1 Tax=Polaromonas sp. TaxID=1869339 RepID=UPI0037535386
MPENDQSVTSTAEEKAKSEGVSVSTTRGDYIHLWPHHQDGTLVYAAEDCVIRLDVHDALDWETSQAYDLAAPNHPDFSLSDRTRFLNRLALLEVAPCDGVSQEKKKHFTRLLGEGVRSCLTFEYESAMQMLDSAEEFILARVQETSRSWYLSAAFWGALPFAIIGAILWFFRTPVINSIGEEALFLLLSAVLGSLGALLSVIARSGKLAFDCSSGRGLHYLEGLSRIAAGALSGSLVAIAIKSEILLAVLTQGGKLHTVMLLGAFVGGAGERLATSIISKLDSTATDIPATNKPKGTKPK